MTQKSDQDRNLHWFGFLDPDPAFNLVPGRIHNTDLNYPDCDICSVCVGQPSTVDRRGGLPPPASMGFPYPLRQVFLPQTKQFSTNSHTFKRKAQNCRILLLFFVSADFNVLCFKLILMFVCF